VKKVARREEMKRNYRYCAFAVTVLLALAPMSGTMSAAEITDK
jgi:hypothetical protein